VKGHERGMPSVFSQGKTLSELEGNIQDAYKMMEEEKYLCVENRFYQYSKST
jgi:predicted RNase H-like HicB family nuclease